MAVSVNWGSSLWESTIRALQFGVYLRASEVGKTPTSEIEVYEPCLVWVLGRGSRTHPGIVGPSGTQDTQ